jgi:hypothetical protein
MNFIGIDPGFDGAVALMSQGPDDVRVSLFDTPTLEVWGGAKRKRHYHIVEMVKILKENMPIQIAALEDVHSMPKQGVASSFVFGRGLGIWEGILTALGIPIQMVSPQRWKKLMLAGCGKEKDASRLRASQLFPQAELSLKKHHGRAEALLMAEYIRQAYRGNLRGDFA